MKKLSKFLRPIALLVVGSALMSCGTNGFMGLDLDGTFILDEHKRVLSSNQGGLPYVVTAQGMARGLYMAEPTFFSCKWKGGGTYRGREILSGRDWGNITDSLRRIDGNIDRIADDINNRQEDIYGDD